MNYKGLNLGTGVFAFIFMTYFLFKGDSFMMGWLMGLLGIFNFFIMRMWDKQ